VTICRRSLMLTADHRPAKAKYSGHTSPPA
jgi:hypothetical protein